MQISDQNIFTIDIKIELKYNIQFLTLRHAYFLQVIEDGVRKVRPLHINKQSEEKYEKLQKEAQMKHARFLNTTASIAFVIFLTIFNIVFWSIAFLEHFRPAEYYLQSDFERHL